MTALFFICLVACLFAGVALMESQHSTTTHPLRLGNGLLTWLTTGNWTAKLGGGLLVIGIGALLRYALLRIEVAPSCKLAGGMAISAALFIAAHYVRTRVGRREIAIALAGAGFGVAYLTAYSAYALFQLLNSNVGLLLLTVVAVGAGTYAILRRALSIALLAMFGAYLAPAFAIESPSPGMVYGYYIAISQLTLVMVAMRGWRALIHLSFLFTLGGGLFFAWTSGFYAPIHYGSMQPLLLALVGIHLAMPIVEGRSTGSPTRFDIAYFIALSATAAALLSIIAPSAIARSNSFLLLGCLWAGAAMAMGALKLKGPIQHGFVASMFMVIAAYLRLPEWNWLLIAEGLSVTALFGTLLLPPLRNYRDLAAGSVLMFAGLGVASSLGRTSFGLPFANSLVLERLASGVMLVAAWRIATRLKHSLAKVFGWFGTIVIGNTLAIELYRCEIASWPLILHAILVAAALIATLYATRRPVSQMWTPLLSLAIVASSAWSVRDATGTLLIGMLIATPVALILLGFRSSKHETDDSRGDRMLSLALVPVVTWLWANVTGRSLAIDGHYFAFSFAAAAACALITLARLRMRHDDWLIQAVALFEIPLGATLFGSTLLFIRAGFWPIALDALCLAGLLQLSAIADRQSRTSKLLYTMTALGGALAIQAMLLRVLGPGGTMTIADVLDLRWPAVISFFWSALGATLTIVAGKFRSRALWSIGAMVLVACAAKLVLLDFGSLGDLTNILALIAAGLVFLIVSWLAPLPPKEQAGIVNEPVEPASPGTIRPSER